MDTGVQKNDKAVYIKEEKKQVWNVFCAFQGQNKNKIFLSMHNFNSKRWINDKDRSFRNVTNNFF